MQLKPDNKLTLEWIKRPDDVVALSFDAHTWKVFEQAAKAREISAENMITSAVVETLSLSTEKHVANPLPAFLKGEDGAVALLFDAHLWQLFDEAARASETSAKHMIVRAVAGSFGAILADNYVLNRFLRS